MFEYSRLAQENALSDVANLTGQAALVHAVEYFEDFRVDSDAINLPRIVYPQACNTGVKSDKVDRNAIKVGSPVLQERGVDYLRLTAVDSPGVEQLYYLADVVGSSLSEAGDGVREVGELGYRGHAVGKHLFFGQSHQGAMLRASSAVADTVLNQVRGCGPRGFRPTRIDFQATVKYPDVPGRGFFRAFSDASDEASRSVVGRRTRPWYVALLDEYGRGDTCYIGARSSENFGRIYDKGRESPEHYDLGSVRFETEHKGSSAMRLLAHLVDDKPDVPSFVAGYVAAFFDSRGVRLPVDVTAVELLRAVEHDTDADRQLRWIARGVVPTISRLVAAGRGDELLVLLREAGLDI